MKNELLLNISYSATIIVLVLLSVLSILFNLWVLFLVWIVLLALFLAAPFLLRKKRKKAKPKEKRKPQKPKVFKKRVKIFKKAAKKKIEEEKKIKVYETKEETFPKPIPGKEKPKLKIIELKKPEKKPGTKTKRIETEFDQLVNLVKEKKEVSFSEVEKKFKLKSEKVEEWAKLLEAHGLVEIRYPTFGKPKLVYRKKEDGKGI